MKKSAVSVFIAAGLMSVLLSGCQFGGGTNKEAEENVSVPAAGTGQEPGAETWEPETREPETREPEIREPETQEPVSLLPYQFAGAYGIIRSEYPVYELDTVIESKLPQKEKTISLTSALHQKQELLVSMVLDDYSEVHKIPAGGEPPADGMYITLSDGSMMIVSEKYQDGLWKSGEGLFLTGPGIPENGIKPVESIYGDYPSYFEAYGNRRHIIEARFELPAAPAPEDTLSGYALRLLDFEDPVEFTLKRVPEYGTLEGLAEAEHGSMDTHDGISIISMGEKVREGILISWNVYSEAGETPISIAYKPPSLDMDLPTISGSGKQYAIRELSANPYWDNLGHYRLSDVRQYGRRTRCLFDVPQEEQDGSFQINIPGITFLNREESAPVTLPIPEDREGLNELIPWQDGSVRILGIARLKEPRPAETGGERDEVKAVGRPEVYINVTAVHEDRDLTLKGLLCQRKLSRGGWEREQYDFDGKGNLSGFHIYYDEGDTEVTLKFHGAAFYWNQPYVMRLDGAEMASVPVFWEHPL